MKFTSHNNDLEKNEALPRDNEARYRRVIHDQTELICRFRPDFILTFINEAYCRYFAKSEQELLGANFLTLIPEAAHKNVLQHFASFTPEHNVSTQEHLVIKPDGEEAWQQWTNRAFFDEKGKVIEFQAVGRDITKRKQAEEALRSAHHELERRVQERTVELAVANAELSKEITEHKLAKDELQRSRQHFVNLDRIARVIAQASDLDDAILSVVREVLDIFKVDRAWLLYPCDPQAPFWRVPVEVTHPEYPGAFAKGTKIPTDATTAAIFRNTLDSIYPVTHSFVGNAQDPEFVRQYDIQSQMIIALHPKIDKPWILGMHQCSYQRVWSDDDKRLFRDVAERVTYALTNQLLLRQLETDIVERKQAERSLRESEEKFRAIFEQAAVGVALIDARTGRFLRVNQKYCDIVGYSQIEMLDTTFQNITHPDDQQAVIQNKQKLVEGEIHEFSIEKRDFRKDGTPIWVNLTVSAMWDIGEKPDFHIAIIEDIEQRKRAEEKTRDLLKQNRSLTQRLFDIQEQERQHLARDLHDEFGQWLTAIQLHAKNIRNIEPDPFSKIHEIANIIEESATQMHKQLHGMIGQLRPSTLDELGLEDSLRELVSQWQESHPDVVCDLSLDGDLHTLEGTLNITLYRLIQEGLTNVTKHAEATNVSIHLQREQSDGVSSDMLRLNIDDNGKGTDLTVPSEGFGLAGMRERSLAAGGNFLINSAVGKGMHITVTLPVRQNGNNAYEIV